MKKSFPSLLCSILIALSVLPQFAYADAVQQLKEFASSAKAASGEFTQRTQRGGSSGADTASGSFVFMRPGKFRWEVKKPFEQLMVADGDKLFFFDKDLNQVTVKRLQESIGASPAMLLFGGGDLDKAFTLKSLPNEGDMEWLEAMPKNKDAGFDSINLAMRGGVPVRMNVRDAFNRTTAFTFGGIEKNPKIEGEPFKFVAPKGADVISQ